MKSKFLKSQFLKFQFLKFQFLKSKFLKPKFLKSKFLKSKFPFKILFIFSFITLIFGLESCKSTSNSSSTVQSNSAQVACPTGNPQSIDYIYRENNRCEGIQSRKNVVSGINLISIVNSDITSYPNTLKLKVPRLDSSSNSTPELKLQSLKKDYLLDNLSLEKNRNSFTFNLKPDVLNKAKVPPNTLHALAKVESVYLPVTIGATSGEYEFVFYSSRRSTFSTFEILHDGKVVYNRSRNNAQKGEIVFTWDGKKENGEKAPTGRYKIRVIAEQERIGRPAEEFKRSYDFEHNPNWLK